MSTPTTTPAVRHAYTCSACGAGVAVVNGKLVRICGHVAAVHANMSATVSQDGKTGTR